MVSNYHKRMRYLGANGLLKKQHEKNKLELDKAEDTLRQKQDEFDDRSLVHSAKYVDTRRGIMDMSTLHDNSQATKPCLICGKGTQSKSQTCQKCKREKDRVSPYQKERDEERKKLFKKLGMTYHGY